VRGCTGHDAQAAHDQQPACAGQEPADHREGDEADQVAELEIAQQQEQAPGQQGREGTMAAAAVIKIASGPAVAAICALIPATMMPRSTAVTSCGAEIVPE
jgi:hypothetical protein